MSISKRDFLALGAAAGASFTLPAWAQAKPLIASINMFVPAAPGGGWDGTARAIERAAKAEGVATIKDLADFVRLKIDKVAPRVNELVELGTLAPVQVEGFKDIAYMHSDWQGMAAQQQLSKANHVTLLSPFDPLTRNRDRAIRLFDFDYKIEIYVPEPKRVYGYYTLPLLQNGKLVGRIDLKSERKTRELLVQSAWHELDLKPSSVDALASDLAKHLGEVRTWQGLDATVVAEKGNLALALKSAVA